MLLYEGELTVAVVKQARQGPVHSIDSPAGKPRLQVSSIDAGRTSLKCMVPGLLGASCSLLELGLNGVQLNGTWAATFGEAAVCSTVLRSLHLS